MSLVGLLHKGFGPAASGGAAPDTPSLAVVDNANGTATATVSSSTSGSSNVVWTLLTSATSWVNSGSRSSDGTVTLTLSDGIYWSYVVSTLNSQDETSAPVGPFRVTSGTQALLEKILTQVQSDVQALALTGIGSGDVVIQKAPDDKKRTAASGLPAVLITPYAAESKNPRDGTNASDDTEHPILVALLDADDRSQTANRNRDLLWREQVAGEFHNKRLDVAGVYTCSADPLNTIGENAWFDKGLFISGYVLKFRSRIVRT